MRNSLVSLIEDLVDLDRQGCRLLLIDADRIPYLAALAADAVCADPTEVDLICKRYVHEFEAKTAQSLGYADLPLSEHPRLFYFLSARKTFRHTLIDSYKANRRDKWSPPLRDAMDEWLIESRGACRFDGYEADDLCGIAGHATVNRIIVSNDKDLFQIPGPLYDPQFDKLYFVDSALARYTKYKQWIMGDSSDGYSGIPGIGVKKAEKFLNGLNIETKTDEEIQQAIYELYKRHGVEDSFFINGVLSKILTSVLGGEGIPWRRSVKTPDHEKVS